MQGGAVFPWRGGNRLSLLVDGDAFFPRMLAAIAEARWRIDLELYLVKDGHCAGLLIDALVAAAQRGVQVRCLFDGFGALGFGATLRARLTEAGVALVLFNPLRWRFGLHNLHRDHRKMLLVDDRLGYIGGTGATDEFWDPQDTSGLWHEVMVEIAGPLLADWRTLFDHQWMLCHEWGRWRSQRPPKPPRIPPVPLRREGSGRLAYAEASQHRDVLQSLIRSLHRANRRIWLATPYFLPTWKVRRALLKAARRGVEVRLLLAGRNTDHPPVRYAGQRYYRRLLRAGVRIFEYQPRFLHLKMVLVDDWVSVGSCNFDHWNLRLNLEANLETRDPAFIAEVVECFLADFQVSHEVDRQQWQARPWYRRLRQRLWGWLDRLVVDLLDRGG
ncbi:phospholipase D-like domain-containing protein [Azotobacter salinestris]|uniref:phospholipase D-like domain-containing protein n=1 Tax=Azotobacter salinestris TaxID=69964 RepID=UPI001266A302|nr:phosphatidylserine/phosphatidylglycerophosphate/cardiolipin synthase family protein [Azotobacter salinestris]